MSRYPANIITKSPATPTGPTTIGRAPGIWRMDEVAYWTRQGLWPNANIQAPDTSFPYVSLLLSTTALGNANNNLFVDSSGAFNPISRTGNTAQGSFSPYSTNWSNYFNGNGNYLGFPSNAALQMGSGDFTVEAWIYLTSYNSPYGGIINTCSNAGSANGFSLILSSSGQLRFFSYVSTSYVADGATIPLNQWVHVAATRSSGTLRLFYNGAVSAAVSNSDNFNGDPSGGGIGGWVGNNSGGITGYISNARIVKGTAVYTGAFTPPTSPLTAISGTSLLTCQSNRFRDASTNNFTITAYGTPSVQDFNPFSPAYPGAVYNQNDIANWSGFFNGGADRLQVPVTSNMYLGTTYTIEAWAYYNSTSYGARPIFNQMEPFQGGFAFLGFGLNTSGQLVAEYRPATSGPVTTITGPTVTPYTWFHIALVCDNSSAKLYINGTQVGSTATFGDYPSAKTNTVAVGSWGSGWNDGGIPAAAWIGYISNVRVVKGVAVYTGNFTPSTTPLTAVSGTVLLTCQNAAFTDNSSVNNILTPVSNATISGNSPFNTVGYWSNYFPSTNTSVLESIVSVPASNAIDIGAGDFTVECWVYLTATQNYSRIIQFNNTWASAGATPLIYANTDIQKLAVASFDFGVALITADNTYAFNTWYHVAVTRAGNVFSMYINGVKQSGTYSSSSRLWATTTPTLSIGNGPTSVGGFSPMQGYVSNVRIIKGTAIYTANFTPPTTPLTAVSGTALLTCQSSRFIDSSANALALTVGSTTSVQSFDPFYTATIASNGGSMYFAPTGSDVLTFPSTPLVDVSTSSFTFECWVYFNGFGSDKKYIIQFSGGNYWQLVHDSSFGISLRVTGYSEIVGQGSNSGWTTGQWYHVALVRNGNSWNIYRNGVSIASATNSSSIGYYSPTYIGNFSSGNSINGYMTDVRITRSAVYTAAFTPPTAPLTPSANTTLLINGMNAGVYDATAINDMETVGNAQVRYPSPFAPANYWAGSFDGSGDYLTIPSNSAFAIGTGQFTLECWIYFNTVTNINEFLWADASGTTGGRLVMYYSGGSLQIVAAGGAGGTSASWTPVAGQWYHLAASRDGSNNQRLFVNGVLLATATSTNNYTENGFSIARAASLNGLISNVRLVKGTAVYTANFTPPTEPLTAISGTSLLTCQNKTFIDNSSNAFTITAVGNATAGAIGPFTATGGTSMYFDGTGDWLDIPTNPTLDFGTGDITIECWLYVTSVATTYQSICQFGDAAGTAGFHILTNTNTICLRTNNSQPLTTSGTITANTWNHIALTRANGTTRLFINGTTSGGTYNWTASLSSGSTRRIGADIYGNPVNGYIDDFRVTRGVARYTSNFTPPTQAFPTY